MSVLAIIGTRAGLKDAKEISENLHDPAYVEKLLPVPRRYLPIYIVLSGIVMGSLGCVIIVVLAYYLDFPLIKDINPAILRNISIIVMSVATIFVFGFLIYDWIRKTRK
jgi:hypothetical protein